jgi:hypothetical protein
MFISSILVLSARIVFAISPEVRQSMREDSTEFAAARATIVVLDPIARTSSPALVVINGRRMGEEEAVALLVTFPKPVACSSVATGDTLTIQCEVLSDPVQVAIHREQIEHMILEIESVLGARYDPLTRLALRGAGRSTLMSVGEYEYWRREYFISASHSRNLTEPDKEAHALGASLVVQYAVQPTITIGGRPK